MYILLLQLHSVENVPVVQDTLDKEIFLFVAICALAISATKSAFLILLSSFLLATVNRYQSQSGRNPLLLFCVCPIRHSHPNPHPNPRI